jgi:DNA-directed RNA polymerase specialized sigma24 family protein
MKMMIQSVDKTPILGLDRETSFSKLYEIAFPLVARFIRSRNGSFEDAKDIFHDAMVIYYEKQVSNIENVPVSEKAYLLGIAKHLWLRKNKADRKLVSLDLMEASIQIPEDYFTPVDTNHILRFLARSGKKCLELLKSFYYDRRSTTEIAETFGYKSLHTATVQKFKCLEKMRDEVKQKSISYEDFLE